MRLAMVGLGRMGLNMARRLIHGGHEVVVYNRTPDKVDLMVKEGAVPAYSPQEVVDKLDPPRVVWLMLPAGEVVDQHVETLAELLAPGDILIDGANSHFKDDIRRAGALEPRGIHYLDAGVSGGIWGLEQGFCTMVGGDAADFRAIEPVFETLAPPEGYLYCGPTGAGHFVKMIHNGVEYALMEAYGEGFELLKRSAYGHALDLGRVAHLWNQGSVIRSWLLELLERALTEDPDLASIQGVVADSGEGRWTVIEAVERGVSAPSIAQSLFRRFESQQPDAFSNRVLAALRNRFGGHRVTKKSS
ncbi:MAG: decarboxylating 6-phosphogluconate dehydrogenase [Proteobacteria bacterium]|nr:decarboxylating 6-phosphogluconate dehydrogenase [Pseudomonadota bacterium]